MEKKIRQYMLEQGMVERSDRIIVGVSGGPDSVCLLCVLTALREEMETGLYAVHVNHLLRGEAADRDEQFVRRLCKSLDVPLTVVREDAARYAKELGLSTEEAGREIRRRAFEQELQSRGAKRIALAHHMNDNAETVLFHLARGTGVRGAAGILPVSGVYIRPLLCVGRAQIERYLAENGTRSCLDHTNLEMIYTRNRIRGELIPYLEAHINPRSVEHIHAFAGQMAKLRAFVERQAAEAFEEIAVRKDGEIRLCISKLLRADEALRPYIIRLAIVSCAGREQDIETVHLRSVEALADKQSGRQTDLPYGLCAVRRYDEICIGPKAEGQQTKEEICLFRMGEDGLPEEMTAEGFPFVPEIRFRVLESAKIRDSFEELPYTKWFDYDIIKTGVNLRTRRPGDRIQVGGQGQTQTLKKYFINNKVPESERDHIPLLADGNDVMWIIGQRQSKKYQVTDTTERILEISITGYGGENNGRKY